MDNEDFYITDEGYKCFTEKYHLKRGYCCKSNCKHCPYGYNPNSPLTLHYITTGAILPEKTFQTKKYPRKKFKKSS